MLLVRHGGSGSQLSQSQRTEWVLYPQSEIEATAVEATPITPAAAPVVTVGPAVILFSGTERVCVALTVALFEPRGAVTHTGHPGEQLR